MCLLYHSQKLLFTVTVYHNTLYITRMHGMIGTNLCFSFTIIQSYILLGVILHSVHVEGYNFTIYRSPKYGQDGGFHFDDIRVLKSPSVVGIDKIYIHFTSNCVLAIQMSYRDINGTCSLGYYHGGGTARGGNNTIISLSNDEYLSRITGRYSTTICYLAFDIKNSRNGSTRSFGYGSKIGRHFTISGPIYGIYGYSGSQIDSLGVYLSKPTYGPVGYVSGTGFWDPVLTHMPAISRLYKVCIRHGSEIDAIQFTYLTTINGTRYNTNRYGGPGGGESCFTLGTLERIRSVDIRYVTYTSFVTITALKFTIMNTRSNLQYIHGPYGRPYGRSGTVTASNGTLGFFGHYSRIRLTALGMIGY